jgi:hypothetical protein
VFGKIEGSIRIVAYSVTDREIKFNAPFHIVPASFHHPMGVVTDHRVVAVHD